MRCLLCWREGRSRGRLCFYHDEAYRGLREGYKRWCAAYGVMGWIRYLERVVELPECGEWVKDVVRMEIKCGGEVEHGV